MFKIELIDNALDSLEHSLEHYRDYQKNNYFSDAKQSVINIISAIDLLLLVAVYDEEGEEGIYERTKSGEIDYNRTIDSFTALKKLGIYSSEEGPSKKEKSSYLSLKRLRNFVIHYSNPHLVYDFEREFSFLIHYAVRFSNSRLSLDLRDYLEAHRELIDELLIDKDWYQQVRRQELLSKYWSLYREHIIEGGSDPVSSDSCYSCGELFVSIDVRLAPIGLCINCLSYNEMESCLRCEELVPSDNMEHGFCESCSNYLKRYYD